MKKPQRDIDELLRRPSEGLNVEVKTWLDLDSPAGIAKIVRGTFALRNRNGGFLIIGLNDKTLKADKDRPPNLQAAYNVDKVQSIVSKYASSIFEVEVAFGKVDGAEVAVIVVPNGVRFPVATKAHLDDPSTGNKLIHVGQVFFRTLKANGTPSTAVAQPQDWEDIVEVCFENREADLGRFLRRLVGSGTGDIAMLLSAMASMRGRKPGADDDEGGTSSGGAPPVEGSGRGRATAASGLRHDTLSFLDEGVKRFSAAVTSRKLDGDALRIAQAGSWEVSLVIHPQKLNQLPTENFQRALASSNPRYTGWPVWLDSSGFTEATNRPVVRQSGWETFIVSLDSWSKHLDFYRFDPNGKFYLHRNLQDDSTDKIRPNTALDPILVMIRIAEAVAVGLSFAKALNWTPEETTLGFAARWDKLAGRTLQSWANPMAYIGGHGEASDDTAISYTELRLDTPTNAIAPAVEELVRPLFILFGGFEMPQPAVEQWVERLLTRQL